MVYTYKPTYYSSVQDSITSMCKNILPFSFKKRRLPAIAAAEQRLWKQQSDNLKWQQESFHQILNLMGLFKEGILAENEVLVFRAHLLETIVSSPFDLEQPVILRDKLIFLQELLYANCISEEEYHASKAPLLQRLTAQGAKIDPKDIIIAGPQQKDPNNEWSVIDSQDSGSKNKPKQQKSGVKQVKGVTSVLGISSSSSIKNGKDNSVGMSQENPFWNCELKEKENEKPTILMAESVVNEDSAKKAKKSPFSGFMKWKKSDDSEKDTVPLSLNDSVKGTYAHPKEGIDTKIKRKLHMDGSSSDFFVDKVLGDKIRKELMKSKAELQLSDDQIEVISTRLPIDKAYAHPKEGIDTKIKRKLHMDGSSSDFFVDKVLGDKIRKELTKSKAELQLSDDQIEVISTRLPIDKADLKKFFAKKWCDQYGETVLEVVRKEYKDHVNEIKNMSIAIKKEQKKPVEEKWTTFDDVNMSSSMKKEQKKTMEQRWTTFDDDDENCHPNLFADPAPVTAGFGTQKDDRSVRASKNRSSTDRLFKNNPFFDY